MTARILIPALFVALGANAAAAELRVGMDGCNPPWSFARAADGKPLAHPCRPDPGRLEGSDVDVAQAIADRLGVRLRIVPVQQEELATALEAGEIDVLLNAWDPRSCPDRKLLYSMPYQYWGLMIAVRRGGTGDRVGGFGDLAGLRVGYVRRPWLERTILAIPARKLKGYDTTAELEAALVDQKVQAVVHDSPYLRWRASQRKVIRTVGDRLTKFFYAAAVRPGEVELRDRLTRAIAGLEKDGELARIQSAWGP